MTDTAWCDTCRRRREVMDTYLTDDGDRYEENAGQGSGARTYMAQPLACGHNAGDGSDRPAVNPRFRPDPTLPGQVAALQSKEATG